ncbi:MAG: hypothetical protein MUC87_16760 [Bacteroidia bacterium]|jgi:hypothetical protein|nr:hypothetical protein [Bacteroidia bacterium]
MKELLNVLLFMGMYFILPYLGAWWAINKLSKRFTSLNNEGFGSRIIRGIVFLGLALVTVAIVITILWLVKLAMAG